MFRLLALAIILLAGSALAETPAQRGRALAVKLCGECHALGRTGASTLPTAPAFRTLSRRIDLDTFRDRLHEGLVSGHNDMPRFTLSRIDAEAFVAYLRSIEAP
jgi:mono/diheme cytochrome c family protein